MKILPKLRTYPIIISAVTIMLSGCGSGGENKNNTNSLNNAISSKDASILQTFSMNLYNSLFLTPNTTYSYQLMDASGNNIADSNGTFICNTPNTCSFSLQLSQQQYLLSVFQGDSNDKLIGGVILNPPTNSSVYSIAIDDVSTSEYLNQLAGSKMSNSFDLPIVQSRLFLPALSYESGTSLNGMLYLYYNYLTQTKGQSNSQAISTISSEYQQCEQSGSCNIDTDFINNPQVLKDAVQKLQDTVTQYSKDKNDIQLYQTYLQIKSTMSTANTVANAASGPLNAIVSGLGSGVVAGMGVISQLIDPYFNAEGLQDSLAAYNRMQAYNQAISSYFTAAIPNYASIQTQLTATMNSAGLSTDYNTNMNYILNDYYSVINEFASSESIAQYIASESATPKNLNWLVNSSGSTGIFGTTNAQLRLNAISYFTNADNVNALSDAYKQVYQLDRVNNVNNIANRHAYNQSILLLMQNIIQALQYAMYLDQLVVTTRDTISIPQGAFLQNMVVSAPRALSPIDKTNFAADTSVINNFYYNSLQTIESNFLSILAPEKAWVAQSVLQSLEIDGKCNITATDGLNTLTATCPVYGDGGNGNIAIKYITSTLDRAATKCLLQDGAEQNMMGVANVQNINGYVACEAAYSGAYAIFSKDLGTNGIDGFGSKNTINMQYFPIGLSGTYNPSGYDYSTSWNYSSSLGIAIGDTVGQNKITNTSFNAYSIPLNSIIDGNSEYLISYIESDPFGNKTPRFLDVLYKLNATGSTPAGFGQVDYDEYTAANENYIFSNTSIPQQQIAAPLQMSMQNPYVNVLLINNPIMSQLPVTIQSVQTFTESNNISINIPSSANLTTIQYRSLFGGTNNALYVAFNYNGQNYSRTLLPNGNYQITDNSIVMTNEQDWETNSTINPYISPLADNLASFTLSGSASAMQCGDLPAAKNALINMGRDELAAGYSCSSKAWGINITLPFSTKLYVPVSANYQGYKAFTIWNKSSYETNGNGWRADQYGTNSNINALVQTYNLSSNVYDGGYLNVNGYNSFLMDYNSQLGGADLWFRN